MASPASTTETRVSAGSIFSALESADRSGWPEYRSASVTAGHVLKLTIRDAHTGTPVRDAWVRGVDVVVNEDNGCPPAFDIGDNAFDMPNYDTRYSVPFKQKDQDALDKAVADGRKLEDESFKLFEECISVSNRIAFTPPPRPPLRIAPDLTDRLAEIDARQLVISNDLSKLEAKIGKLLQKREQRRDWVHAVKALLAVAGKWDDPIDWTEPDGWTTKAGAGFKKVTGKSLWGGKNPTFAVGHLWQIIGRVYKTDRNGAVSIPLPAETEGWARIEMRHLKLLDPADAAGFEPHVSPACRAEWTGGGDTSCDDPTADPVPEVSKWMLVQVCEKRVEAPFRNYLVIPFDTTARSCTEPILSETLALVWSQCAWMAVGEKDYVLEPEDTSIWDGRGLADDHPTLFVPTRPTGSGRRYGEFGNARTIGKNTEAFPGLVDKHVVEAGTTWYSWIDAWKIVGEYTKGADADAALAALTEPHKSGHKVSTTAQAKSEREAIKVNEGTTHVLIRTRDYSAHGVSKEVAEAAALNYVYLENLNSKASRTVTRINVPGEKGDAGISWRISYKKTTSGYLVSYQSRVFKDPKSAIRTLFNNRIHNGVDVAGKIGDPIFAPIGGTTKTSGKETDHGSGLKVGVKPWRRDNIEYISMMHNKENIAGIGTLVKAGDVVAIMGRTGNHRPWKKNGKWRGDTGAPTHTHFAAYKGGKLVDFTRAIVPDHGSQQPRNAMPHLLPCAGEYEDGDVNPLRAASDPRKCKVRHGSGAFDPSAPKKAGLCWAYAKGVCPFK